MKKGWKNSSGCREFIYKNGSSYEEDTKGFHGQEKVSIYLFIDFETENIKLTLIYFWLSICYFPMWTITGLCMLHAIFLTLKGITIQDLKLIWKWNEV